MAVSALLSGGCFTGVEGTKRISENEVRRQQAANISPEQIFLSDIRPTPPAQWKPGRRLKVTDERISLIFTPVSDDAAGLEGSVLEFRGFEPARSLTGDDATDMCLSDKRGRRYYYRLGSELPAIDTLSSLAVPFTVDMELIERVDSAMRGQNYYVSTPLWLDPRSHSRIDGGLRHVKVRIDSVGTGNANYPAAVYFTAKEGPEGQHMLYMTLGNSRAATRNFDTQFSFRNPRERFPEIRDDVWELITRSRIREGMTRDECRLALGNPHRLEQIPTYGGMVERWHYSDGVFLVFEDGFLTRFRK